MTPLEVMAFALLGLVVALLTLGGLALFWVAGQEKRTIERLAHTPCPVCRQVLGAQAINAGRMRTHEAFEAARAEEAGDEPVEPSTDHLLASWLIECPHCRTLMQYDVQGRRWLHVQHPHRVD